MKVYSDGDANKVLAWELNTLSSEKKPKVSQDSVEKRQAREARKQAKKDYETTRTEKKMNAKARRKRRHDLEEAVEQANGNENQNYSVFSSRCCFQVDLFWNDFCNM